MAYDLGPHIIGNTWNGINNITFSRGGSAIDLSGAYVAMEVLRSIDSPIVLSLTTANSGISITNPSQGMIRVLPLVVDIPVDLYKWRVHLVLADGEEKTYLMGIWEIQSNLPTETWKISSVAPVPVT